MMDARGLGQEMENETSLLCTSEIRTPILGKIVKINGTIDNCIEGERVAIIQVCEPEEKREHFSTARNTCLDLNGIFDLLTEGDYETKDLEGLFHNENMVGNDNSSGITSLNIDGNSDIIEAQTNCKQSDSHVPSSSNNSKKESKKPCPLCQKYSKHFSLHLRQHPLAKTEVKDLCYKLIRVTLGGVWKDADDDDGEEEIFDPFDDEADPDYVPGQSSGHSTPELVPESSLRTDSMPPNKRSKGRCFYSDKEREIFKNVFADFMEKCQVPTLAKIREIVANDFRCQHLCDEKLDPVKVKGAMQNFINKEKKKR